MRLAFVKMAHVRHALLPFPAAIPPHRFARRRREVIADDPRAVLTGQCDDGCAIGHGRVGVVDCDGKSLGESRADEFGLPCILVGLGWPMVLADVTVRGREALLVERGLPRCGQPDEDHALGHERILSDAALGCRFFSTQTSVP